MIVMAADEYVDVRVTHYHCSKEVPFLSWERKRGLLRPGRLAPFNPLRYVKAFHLTADRSSPGIAYLYTANLA